LNVELLIYLHCLSEHKASLWYIYNIAEGISEERKDETYPALITNYVYSLKAWSFTCILFRK